LSSPESVFLEDVHVFVKTFRGRSMMKMRGIFGALVVGTVLAIA